MMPMAYELAADTYYGLGIMTYRVARAWEISQAYKVVQGGSVCSELQD